MGMQQVSRYYLTVSKKFLFFYKNGFEFFYIDYEKLTPCIDDDIEYITLIIISYLIK